MSSEYNSNFPWISKYPPDVPEDINATIIVSANVWATEEDTKVLKALETLFPEITFSNNNNIISGRTNHLTALNNLAERMYEQKILDAGRRRVLQGSLDTLAEFYLHKQVALVNKVAFCEPDESPMGPITVKIISDSLNQLIRLYFPKYEWFYESKELD